MKLSMNWLSERFGAPLAPDSIPASMANVVITLRHAW